MGYGSINGFRLLLPLHLLRNLKTETITKLRLCPYCFMDANSFYEQKYNARRSIGNYLNMPKNADKERNADHAFSIQQLPWETINSSNGWKEMYERFISQLPPAAAFFFDAVVNQVTPMRVTMAPQRIFIVNFSSNTQDATTIATSGLI